MLGSKDRVTAPQLESEPPVRHAADAAGLGEGTGPAAGRQQEGDLVVHILSMDSICAECHCEIAAETMLAVQDGRITCLKCAGLEHLVLLKSGNATLTKRATEQFGRRIIVWRVFKTRPAIRRGVLVDNQALERADAQCAADNEQRARNRRKQKARRLMEDEAFVAKFAEKIEELFPNCPAEEREAIARHACARGSGRVGRSAGGKALEEAAVIAAVKAHIRHVHTPYDQLTGPDPAVRSWAHDHVRPQVNEIFDQWRKGAAEGGGAE